ncbi:methyltransferase domain-containing protein [Rugosimonospora africana]|uniref:Methyltransferase type 11 n=1 Tax=Rugosimonospora africana TaxID=556532 RepID=A0A8J3QZG3_9ACTN|nr:methyltransferase domain-containing protein [Rugosimonospora africana]GIH17451.1 methyltransferase type 11 [Rugosimonospora africana]
MSTFDELIDEAASASVEGWDFSWLDGRATEERPGWGYARMMAERMARARVAVELQAGGGEVLAGVPELPAVTAATESWPPNLARAAARLAPRGVRVVGDDGTHLPLRSGAFDLVVSRHPVSTPWAEIARVLAPGGTYFSQQVGPDSVIELTDFFLGRWPRGQSGREPELAEAAARAAGLSVVDLREATLRAVFHDVGAVAYFLRKVIWIVPGFTVERYRERLAAMHDLIEAEGPFVAHSTRFLIEARKPETANA